MPQLDAITRRRLARFRSMRRGWWSFIVLAVLCGLAALGPLLVGNRPLVLRHDDQWRFPVFSARIAASELGLPGDVAARGRPEADRRVVLDEGDGEEHEHHRHHVQAHRLDLGE